MKRAADRQPMRYQVLERTLDVPPETEEDPTHALRLEMDAALQRINERSHLLTSVDLEWLGAYAATLVPSAIHEHLGHLGELLLLVGAVQNFSRLIDSERVLHLRHNTRYFTLEPDEQTRVLETLSKALSSRSHWRYIDFSFIPHLPQHTAHSNAHAVLIDALRSCTIDRLALMQNEDSESFINAISPHHRFKEFSLALPLQSSDAVNLTCLEKLCMLIEKGQITNKLTLFLPRYGNTPAGKNLRTATYPRLLSAIGGRKRFSRVSLVVDAGQALPFLDEIISQKGANLETLQLIVRGQPTRNDVAAIAHRLPRLLSCNTLLSMELALPMIELISMDDKKEILSSAIRSTSLCDTFHLKNGRLDCFGTISVSDDVASAGELIRIDGPEDPELRSLIDTLALTLQRNRLRAFRHNHAFIAGAAGSIKFFPSGSTFISHQDIGNCLASALECDSRRNTQQYKEYDVNGLHRVNKAAWEGAQRNRSEHYLARLRKPLAKKTPRRCLKAIKRLRTLVGADVLMEDHLLQAVHEIGKQADELGLSNRVDLPLQQRDLMGWFIDIRWQKAISESSKLAMTTFRV